MSTLTPNLFTRRFNDFVEIGRARLRPLAPEWTDHNAHDPGITVMELLAWVAEAQLYSVSRLRRDERLAYAALMGVESRGATSATGVIWPDDSDLQAPTRTFAKSLVIADDAIVNVLGEETPTFRPQFEVLWAPGTIIRLQSRLGDGRVTDHTRVNERGGPPFLPFGERAGRRDVFTMTFACRDEAGLFGANRDMTKGAVWAIGVLAAPPLRGDDARRSKPTSRSPLTAAFVDGSARVPLRIVSDSTNGFLSSGAVVLALDGIPDGTRAVTLEFRAPRGLPRPPRVLRIAPNVLPIRQGREITREPHEPNGWPNWSFDLEAERSLLRFEAGDEPVRVEVAEGAGINEWRRTNNLLDRGPNEHVFEFDVKTRRVTFGNDINGRIPPRESQVLVSYAVTDGAKGRVAPGRQWHVQGFGVAFGINPEPMANGADAPEFIDDRRDARRRVQKSHALVSVDDLVDAAKAIPLLEVARAWVVPPDRRTPRTGVVTLVAMRARPGGEEPDVAPETPQWLEAIRRRLAPRIPLATRLAVVAPRYADFSIRARIESKRGRDPKVIAEKIREQLRRRLAIVDAVDGRPPRDPGVPLTRRDVAALLRATDGVARVIEPELLRNGQPVPTIAVPASGLPRYVSSQSTIDVERPAIGGRP